MPHFLGIQHVAITVNDMETTAEWWCRVFGFVRLGRFDEPPDSGRHPRILLQHPTSGVGLGLHQPHNRSADQFDPDRTGLDHLAFTVPERDDLQRWREHLEAFEVPCSPEREASGGFFVSFTDPDSVQFEIWWPKA